MSATGRRLIAVRRLQHRGVRVAGRRRVGAGMRVPLSWLREYVPIDLQVAELAHRLTMAGVEVGSWETLGAEWQRITIGRVKDLTPHPRNRGWTLATLDLGDGRATLVTAATNLHAGDVVPVVRQGGSLPGRAADRGTRLRRREVRGDALPASSLASTTTARASTCWSRTRRWGLNWRATWATSCSTWT